MIFSDDRDKLIGILNSTISLLDNLNYDDQDCYSLEDLKHYCTQNIKDKNTYLIALYLLYIYSSLTYTEDFIKKYA